MTQYTIDDYSRAKEAFKAIQAQWNAYIGATDIKFHKPLKEARKLYMAIEEDLKEAGVIQRTDKEKFKKLLDSQGNGKPTHGKQITYDGKIYTCKIYPLSKGKNGAVLLWGHDWMPK